MKKLSFSKALSAAELVLAIFVVFFLYSFVIKQVIADIKFSDMKNYATIVYFQLNIAAKNILSYKNFENNFYNEYDILKSFSKSLNPKKICQNAKKENCWSTNWLWDNLAKPGIVLQDGQFVMAELSSTDCTSHVPFKNTCGALYIDTNGTNEPNEIGKDIIKVYITKKGLLPAGAGNDNVNPQKSCDFINKFSWGCSSKLVGIK